MNNINEEERERIRNYNIFIKQIKYIIIIIYLILSIISVFISLHCSSFFSIETLIAFFLPFIYIPIKLYLGDKQCKLLPDKLCIY